MTELERAIFSLSVICETANSSRHFRMVAPGLPERIISPAILRAKTSRMLGETDMRWLLVHPLYAWGIKLYRFRRNTRSDQSNYENQRDPSNHRNCTEHVRGC